MSDTRRRVVAHGQVQGVFFRDSTRREAERRGVSGWARNTDEGTVEAVFEGAPDAVEALVEFVRGGPGHASVSHVDVHDEPPKGSRASTPAERARLARTSVAVPRAEVENASSGRRSAHKGKGIRHVDARAP